MPPFAFLEIVQVSPCSIAVILYGRHIYSVIYCGIVSFLGYLVNVAVFASGERECLLLINSSSFVVGFTMWGAR